MPPATGERPIGSAGLTTSYRMGIYASRLHSLGIKASIGEGKRSDEVKEAMKKYKGVYFGGAGGAGALLPNYTAESTVIAFTQLGSEAIRAMKVKDFPLLVISDCCGGELYVKPKLDTAG